MPWFLESDTFADEPVWPALSGGSVDLEDRLQSAYTRLKAKASHVRKDGYVMASKALEACRGRKRVLELLCTPVLGEPPLVHRRGERCECLGEHWIDGYEYRIHSFLKKNPSRAENDRKKAMDADRGDHRLRALVYRRDGGCCRYCRSGPLPTNMGRAKDRRKVRTYDHVDPDKPATPEGGNYVVACDRCNVDKAHCTPDEADMVLLPEPTEAERVAWLTRDLQLHDRPDPSPTAVRPLSDRGTDRGTDRDPTAIHDAIGDRDPTAVDRGPDNADSTAEVYPDPDAGTDDRGGTRSPDPSGLGRGAGDGGQSREPPPRSRPEDQPPRTGAHPDIYHRRSRASPYVWPEGFTTERPRSSDEGGDRDGRQRVTPGAGGPADPSRRGMGLPAGRPAAGTAEHAQDPMQRNEGAEDG